MSNHPNTTNPPPTAATPVDDDPLAHLYRMSRTAGLGTGEYSSINPLAVAGLFFGIASVMVIYGWILLLIPFTAVILCLVALRQIIGSNGTQVGAWLAVIGLILATLFGGWELASGAIEEARTHEDRQQITALIDHFSQDAQTKNLQDAYNLFTPKFKAIITPDAFEQQFKIRYDSPYYGQIKSITWNGRVGFEAGADPGELLAAAIVLVAADHLTEPVRNKMVFHKLSGQWMIDAMPDWFTPPPPKPAPSAPAGPMGPPAPAGS
jgi:hypothetical protein